MSNATFVASTAPAAAMRARIAAVFAADSGASLARFAAHRRPQLHYSITFTRDHQTALAAIAAYIHCLPDFIDAIGKRAAEQGFYDQVAPLIEVCVAYFVSPPPDIPEAHTRLGLLDEAYLGHRVLEEINDRLMSRLGAPLVPMDTTTANLIMHDFIGEPFANHLDALALGACDQLFNRLAPHASHLGQLAQGDALEGWSETLNRWPGLAENFGMSLNFASQQSRLQ